jgi:hypothetical protein
MNQGAEQATSSIHVQIASGPDCGRAYVAGKDRIFACQLIDDLRDILRMNWRAAGLSYGQIVKSLTRLLIVAEAFLEIRIVIFIFKQRNKRLQGIVDR